MAMEVYEKLNSCFDRVLLVPVADYPARHITQCHTGMFEKAKLDAAREQQLLPSGLFGICIIIYLWNNSNKSKKKENN